MNNTNYHVVFQCNEFIVVHKYPNVNFHTEDGVLGLFEQVKKNESLTTLYPVHRLDKVTSGLLVMAKTPGINKQLCEQFSTKKVDKFYLGISGLKPRKKQGAVVGDMQAARRGSWMLTRGLSNPAKTQFFSSGLSPGLRLFIIKPLTGKTHQIRVALKSLGSPILGDALYGAKEHKQDRTYLHAYSLGFNCNGESYRFSELPAQGDLFQTTDFKVLMATYAEPWSLTWPAAK